MDFIRISRIKYKAWALNSNFLRILISLYKRLLPFEAIFFKRALISTGEYISKKEAKFTFNNIIIIKI